VPKLGLHQRERRKERDKTGGTIRMNVWNEPIQDMACVVKTWNPPLIPKKPENANENFVSFEI